MSLTIKYWAEKKEEESRERTNFVLLKNFELVLEKFDVLAKNLNLVIFPSLLTCLQISNLIYGKLPDITFHGRHCFLPVISHHGS